MIYLITKYIIQKIMNKEKILSISVAAYNLEDLVKENIESFLKCKYKDEIEVLVIDDGSKDNTAEVVSEYQKKYPNTIRLIKQKNAGPGSTVNTGIKNATGKYFKMIDGDDWVESENVDKLIESIRDLDADMIITNYEIFNNKLGKIIKNLKPNLISGKIANFSEICNSNNLVMHTITYKTSILQENNIKLDNGFYTDIEYLLLPTPYIKTAIYFDLNIYVYRVARAGQSVDVKSMQKNIEMHNIVLNRLIDFYENDCKDIDENLKKYLSKRISVMAWTQTLTLLSYNYSKKMKEDIKRFALSLKSKSSDIFDMYSKNKYVKFMINSNYSTVWILSILRKIKSKI